MGIIVLIGIGIVVGLVARVVLPGRERMGLFATCLTGLMGSLVGGVLLGSLLDPHTKPFELTPLDIILAVAGACIFLVALSVANSRRAHA